jgi:hypothetical protein
MIGAGFAKPEYGHRVREVYMIKQSSSNFKKKKFEAIF